MNTQRRGDTPPVVVVGAGLAGLTVALEAAVDRPVVVLAKRRLDEGATAWAQGRIGPAAAASLSEKPELATTAIILIAISIHAILQRRFQR